MILQQFGCRFVKWPWYWYILVTLFMVSVFQPKGQLVSHFKHHTLPSDDSSITATHYCAYSVDFRTLIALNFFCGWSMPRNECGHNRGRCGVIRILVFTLYIASSLGIFPPGNYIDAGRVNLAEVRVSHSAFKVTLALLWTASRIVVPIILLWYCSWGLS